MERARLVGPADKWNVLRKFQIHFLKSNGLEPEHTLVDIGCGVLRGGIPLIDYLDEGNYYGIETRQHVLDEGREEVIAAGLEDKNPHLICNADGFNELSFPETKFDVMWAYSVLFHMSDETLQECLDFVARYLDTNGVFYANVYTGPKHIGVWGNHGLPKIRRPLEEYKRMCTRAGLQNVEVIGTVEDWGLKGVKEVQNKPILKITL